MTTKKTKTIKTTKTNTKSAKTTTKSVKPRPVKSIGGYPKPKAGMLTKTETINGIEYTIATAKPAPLPATHQLPAPAIVPAEIISPSEILSPTEQKAQDQTRLERIREDQEAVSGAYKIDVSQGHVVSDVSRQWFNRPDDQRFASFEELERYVRGRRLVSSETLVNIADITTSTDSMTLQIPLTDRQTGNTAYRSLVPTNFAFNQLAAMAGARPSYLQTLPPDLAAACLRHGLRNVKGEQVKTLSYHHPGELAQLAAITTPDFGRIWDADILDIVKYMLQTDHRWKIPGEIDWSNMTQNPYVDITKDNTTLFASDRDIWMFFCQDAHPIEAGKTKNGDTDVYFPGFYIYGTEVGSGLPGKMAGMMLRGICWNRNLWGVEGLREIKVRHSKNGPERFKKEALESIYNTKNINAKPFVELMQRARTLQIAKNDEEAMDFLNEKKKITKEKVKEIMKVSQQEEEKALRTVFDFSTALTAFGRRLPNQDERGNFEKIGAEILQLAS